MMAAKVITKTKIAGSISTFQDIHQKLSIFLRHAPNDPPQARQGEAGMKFRKKPVVIEAMRFDGTSTGAWEIVRWAGPTSNVEHIQTSNRDHPHVIRIETFERIHRAMKGDWVIKGIKGVFYPCKPDIFEATYEAVE